MADYGQMAKWLLGNWDAPARAYNAQSPSADFGSGLLGNFLTKAHQAIDPVNGLGGYGGLLAMALPPGSAKMPYSIAKAARDSLEAQLSAAGAKLNTYPKVDSGPLRSLTPDSIKQTPEWQADYAAKNKAHETLRRFNQDFVKTYKDEIAAERRNRFK